MKVAIWILTFFITTAINTTLGTIFGFKLGALLLYIVACAIARVLCKKWDERNKPRDEATDDSIEMPIKFKQHYWKFDEKDRKEIFDNSVLKAWKLASQVAKTQGVGKFENISNSFQIQYLDVYVHIIRMLNSKKPNSDIADELCKCFSDIFSSQSQAIKAVDVARKSIDSDQVNGTTQIVNTLDNPEEKPSKVCVKEEYEKENMSLEGTATDNFTDEQFEDNTETKKTEETADNLFDANQVKKASHKIHVTVKSTTSRPKFCRKCGSPLNNDDAFCRKCGTKSI